LNLNDVIQETIELARMDLYGAVLQTELSSELPEVIADRVQLQQVLLNLAANAIDAMKPVTDRPRVLRIRTKDHEKSAVLVMVEDSGIGLNPKQKEQLFESFFTTKSDGLGMGLSICRSIIEEHGGRLWVEPNSGPGATFQFTLPIARGGAM
jgi:signal transduction histidine kinase